MVDKIFWCAKCMFSFLSILRFLIGFWCNLWSLMKHRGAEVDVKKLNKRPAPPRFGRKLTETQKASHTLLFSKIGLNPHLCRSLTNWFVLTYHSLLQARATHICLDCGFIYTLSKPFDEQVSLNPSLLFYTSLHHNFFSLLGSKDVSRVWLEKFWFGFYVYL